MKLKRIDNGVSITEKTLHVGGKNIAQSLGAIDLLFENPTNADARDAGDEDAL